MEQHPLSAVRLLVAGADIATRIGGVASGYATPSMSLQIISQYVDEAGNPAEPPPPITNVEQAEEIIAAYDREA
jgi:hypothetical protein